MNNREQRWEHQLSRIETLTDVVFAVILVRTFVLLPKPSAAERSAGDMLDFYVENLGAFAMVLIGFLVTIIYWVQSNATFGLLRRTDTRHTIFSLIQLVALLLFMYAIRMGIDYDGDTFAMVFESSTAALMGFVGWANWNYATRDRKLMHDWVTDGEILKCSLRLIPEPVTAVLTIPCAFIHPGVWGLSWFALGPVARWVTKRKLSS